MNFKCIKPEKIIQKTIKHLYRTSLILIMSNNKIKLLILNQLTILRIPLKYKKRKTTLTLFNQV
jgi:hypothetical protein